MTLRACVRASVIRNCVRSMLYAMLDSTRLDSTARALDDGDERRRQAHVKINARIVRRLLLLLQCISGRPERLARVRRVVCVCVRLRFASLVFVALGGRVRMEYACVCVCLSTILSPRREQYLVINGRQQRRR